MSHETQPGKKHERTRSIYTRNRTTEDTWQQPSGHNTLSVRWSKLLLPRARADGKVRKS